MIKEYTQSEAGLALAYAVTLPYFLLFLSFNLNNTNMYLASLGITGVAWHGVYSACMACMAWHT